MEMITGDALDQALEDIRLSADSFQAAYDIFVPDRGPAPSVGGEVLRAMMRIMYRDENDGDLFYEGYGKETCGDAVAYLIKFDPDLENDFAEIAQDELRDEEYTDALSEIALYLGEQLFLRQTELFEQPNTDDYQKYNGPKFIAEMGWEPLYSWEEYIPGELQSLMDSGFIDSYDIQTNIEYWDCVANCDADVTVDRKGLVQISDCDKDCYTELEENGLDWLYKMAEDIEAEHADELEEEEEDEEY